MACDRGCDGGEVDSDGWLAGWLAVVVSEVETDEVVEVDDGMLVSEKNDLGWWKSWRVVVEVGGGGIDANRDLLVMECAAED